MEHNDERDANDQREHDADAGVGTSADDAATHDLDLDDFAHLDEPDPTDESLKTDDEGVLTSDEPAAAAAEEVPPFHEHPRWQEMLAERDELKGQVQQQGGTLEEQARRIDEYDRHLRMMDTLSRQQPMQQAMPEQIATDPFDEILAMPEEEIIDEFQKGPRQFLESFGQSITQKALASAESVAYARAQDDAITKGIDQFADENPDFMDMVIAGDIARYIDRNPIHNAISAYHTLKSQGSDEEYDSEMAKYEEQVREDEREKTLASVRAKQGAQVLDGSAGAGGPNAAANTAIDPDLQDTAKHGGKRHVLAQRLKAFRERF
jgi:hypothetical protein